LIRKLNEKKYSLNKSLEERYKTQKVGGEVAMRRSLEDFTM
jgi:hypothetical protein